MHLTELNQSTGWFQGMQPNMIRYWNNHAFNRTEPKYMYIQNEMLFYTASDLQSSYKRKKNKVVYWFEKFILFP